MLPRVVAASRSAAASAANVATRASSTQTQNLDPVQEALLAEQCILVNERDHAVGQASKRECHKLDAKGRAPLHRAFSLFVFNSRDELLMQRRSDAKITFPGLWTNTCCSHPLAVDGETEKSDGRGAKRAAQRRIVDELGVPADQCRPEDMTYLTRILYSAASEGGEWGEHELDYILFLRGDVDVSANPNEVQDTCYVKKGELDEFLRQCAADGVGITPWFELIARSMLPVWWDNLDKLDEYKEHEKILKFSK